MRRRVSRIGSKVPQLRRTAVHVLWHACTHGGADGSGGDFGDNSTCAPAASPLTSCLLFLAIGDAGAPLAARASGV